MKDSEREQLKTQLQEFCQSPCGIGLDTPFHWAVDCVNDPALFFEHLSLLMQPESVLYFEGTRILHEAADFYTRHQAPNPVPVCRETVFPIPETYHVKFSLDVAAGLHELMSRHPVSSLFDHIKGYRSGSLVFTFHDAFTGCLRVSENVPEAALRAFCGTLGVSYRHERTEQVNVQKQLQGLLQAMEHPDQVKIYGDTWWRRLARKLRIT